MNNVPEVIKALTKKYGENFIQQATEVTPKRIIPTGSISLDLALLGGWHEPMYHMPMGERHSGKTTLSLMACAEALKKYPDKYVIYVDLEGYLDTTWAKALGCDISRIIVVEQEVLEEIYRAVNDFAMTGQCCVLVVDSVPSLMEEAGFEKDEHGNRINKGAKAINDLIKKLGIIRTRLGDNAPTVFFINQFRENTSPTPTMYKPKGIPGGKGLQFWTDAQVVMRGKETLIRDTPLLKNSGLYKDLAAYNEHEFEIKRQKNGNSFNKGDFTLFRVTAEDTHFIQGHIDNAPKLAFYAKAFGYHTGATKAQYITTIDNKFGSQEDIVTYLRENEDEAKFLGQVLIAHHRKSVGKPPLPPDKYLYGGIVDEERLASVLQA